MQPAKDALTALAHALAYHESKDSAAPGAGQVALRVTIAHGDIANPDRAKAEMRRLKAIDIADMPPATGDVALLLDALAFRAGAISRADAWRAIGISSGRGRDLLARNAGAVDWPIWRTMRLYALEDGFKSKVDKDPNHEAE